MPNEPGAAVLAMFDKLIDRVKKTMPQRSDGKPVFGEVVFAQMPLGMLVDKQDYYRPWSPMGGSSLRDTASRGQLPSAAPAPAPAAGAGDAGGGVAVAAPPAPPAIDPQLLQAMQAAFKTAMLCNVMLQVTTDGSYHEYPTGRHLDFAYNNIVNGMQPLPMPPIAPDVQKQIDQARTVLYEVDTDGSIIGKSKRYKNYLDNAKAYAKAKSDYALAMAAARADPAKAQIWPQQSVTFQQAVDEAYDTFKTEGAETVERALDIIESVGICMQDRMIAKARKLFDDWNLGLAGVPSPVPYSFIEPTDWCDPDRDDIGWESLEVTSSDYQSYDSSRFTRSSQGSWKTDSSSAGGGGAVSIGFAAFGGTHSESDAHSSWQSSSGYSYSNNFKNTAKNMHIKMEYGLCTMYRPWLVSDLFYMKNWYLVGNAKNSISDGTVTGQAGSEHPLLPMIPQQFLVIRNVEISTSDWGEDSEVLRSAYGGAQGSTESHSSSNAGSGGVCLGFVNFGGTAASSSSSASGQSSSWGAASGDSHFGATFDGTTLKIKGAQIIAFLCPIVPACPPIDEPAAPAGGGH